MIYLVLAVPLIVAASAAATIYAWAYRAEKRAERERIVVRHWRGGGLR